MKLFLYERKNVLKCQLKWWSDFFLIGQFLTGKTYLLKRKLKGKQMITEEPKTENLKLWNLRNVCNESKKLRKCMVFRVKRSVNLSLSSSFSLLNAVCEVSHFFLCSLVPNGTSIWCEEVEIDWSIDLFDLFCFCTETKLAYEVLECCVPRDKVRELDALRIIGALCTFDSTLCIRSIQWLRKLCMSDCLTSTRSLYAAYPALFHLLRDSTLRPHLCPLLTLLTTPRHVLPYRIRYLYPNLVDIQSFDILFHLSIFSWRFCQCLVADYVQMLGPKNLGFCN